MARTVFDILSGNPTYRNFIEGQIDDLYDPVRWTDEDGLSPKYPSQAEIDAIKAFYLGLTYYRDLTKSWILESNSLILTQPWTNIVTDQKKGVGWEKSIFYRGNLSPLLEDQVETFKIVYNYETITDYINNNPTGMILNADQEVKWDRRNKQWTLGGIPQVV